MSDIPVPPPLPSENSAKPQTKMPWWMKIILGLGIFFAAALAVLAGLGSREFASDAERWGFVVGTCVAPTLIIWGICALFKKLRIAKAGWVIALVLLGISCLGSLAKIGSIATGSICKRQTEKQTLTNFSGRITDLQQRVYNTANISDTATLDKLQKEAVDIVNDMGEQAGGDAQAIAKITMETLLPLMQENAKQLAEMNQLLGTEGWIVTYAKSKDDLQKGLNGLRQLSAQNQKLRDLLSGMGDRLKQNLEKSNASSEAKRGAFRGIEKFMEVQKPLMVEKFETDGEVCNAAVRILSLLDEHWGSWHLENGFVVWNKQNDLDEFQKRVTAYDELVDKQNQVIQKFREMQLREVKQTFGN